jgi:hypothetical protein
MKAETEETEEGEERMDGQGEGESVTYSEVEKEAEKEAGTEFQEVAETKEGEEDKEEGSLRVEVGGVGGGGLLRAGKRLVKGRKGKEGQNDERWQGRTDSGSACGRRRPSSCP